MNPDSADEQTIRELLATYQQSLNASNTAAAIALYAQDGVFMAPNSPSNVGIDAVREAYDAVFAAITLNVTFTIVEVKQCAPDWAFARTNSAGTTTIHATGESVHEANQELFIFHKLNGKWKIARYSFSTTNPVKP